MKSKIIILALVVILIGLFSMFNITNSYPFKENVLYNQDDISGYNETQTESSNLVNRNEAIKIAKYYIGNILGNDLSEEDNKMYVNLYKNDRQAESYYWNISWSSPNLSCGIEINTINKQINNIYVSRDFNQGDNKVNTTLLNQYEVLDIVENFVEALGFDLNIYKLDTNNMNYNIDGNQICTFVNKNNPEDRFEIDISITGKFITRYVRNP
ncbi:MAG: hypothetical protein ACLS50_08095 [Clostridium sp.]|uniref:hypothetical protein n=1 Tax=Clostridium sp. 2218st1_F5_2218SCRN_220325 TaxID=3143056 RepID=UPI00319E871E